MMWRNVMIYHNSLKSMKIMNTETKICQNCKQNFTIKPEDFGFYEKIKVPPPTFCQECRLQRRLATFNIFNLYQRKCDLCKSDMVSNFPKDSPYTIYCQKCWWSDKWNYLDYGRDYDFSRPFFEQWNELLHKTPIIVLKDGTRFFMIILKIAIFYFTQTMTRTRRMDFI